MDRNVKEKDVVIHLVMGLTKNRFPSLLDVEDKRKELVMTGTQPPLFKAVDINVFRKTEFEKEVLKKAKLQFRDDMRAMYPDFIRKNQGKLKYQSVHVRTED